MVFSPIRISSLVFTILFSALISFLTSPLAILISKKIGLMDVPGTAPHKMHKIAMPIAGGMILLVALLAAFFIFMPSSDPQVIGLIAGGVVIFVFGVIDDRIGLSAPIKITGQLVATTIVMVSGVRVHFLESSEIFPLGISTLNVIMDIGITVFWIVGITNAVNLIDSMDGLAPGVCCTAAGYFLINTLISGQVDLATFSAILLGICVSLYNLNAPPSRLFLGDSGAQTLGYLLSILAILYTPHQIYQFSSWFVPIIILAIPIFDTCLVFFSRLRRKVPFYLGNLDHTYHRLRKLGLEQQQAVRSMIVAGIFLDMISLIAMAQKPLLANLIFGGCIILGIAAFFFLEKALK